MDKERSKDWSFEKKGRNNKSKNKTKKPVSKFSKKDDKNITFKKTNENKYENKKTKNMDEKMSKKRKVENTYNKDKKENPRSKTERSKKPLRKDICPRYRDCGGCQLQETPYAKQLEMKQKQVNQLLGKFCTVHPILGMEHPFHYRNKVHAVFTHDRKGNPVSGVYREGTHEVIPVDSCLIEDQKADEIIVSIRSLLKSFKIKTYDEDTDFGLLRHVLIRKGFHSGEIMVVLVLASPILPSKKNFINALRKIHPEITTIVLNVNDRFTSMVLGDKEQVIYGKGFIEDTLCGKKFRISSKSFYQVNPIQTEKLYEKAIACANLTGKETILDAYCGIGTIGLVASDHAKEVIGIELNKDAVKDAKFNAKINNVNNVKFYAGDAGECMVDMAEDGMKFDVVFMDPPRSGSDEKFLSSLVKVGPEKIVYVSCNPVTLERDLQYLRKKGYQAKGAWPVDMFPWTNHVETVCLLSRKDK